VSTWNSRSAETTPLPKSFATAAAVHRALLRQTALMKRGPPVSMRTVVAGCAAFGGKPHGGPTIKSFLKRTGSEDGGLLTRQMLIWHSSGNWLLMKNPARLGDKLCAAWR
jgi:hypothetical protein